MTVTVVTGSFLIAPIVEALDLGDPNWIRSIKLMPTTVEVEFFKMDDNCRKHVDLETGEVATVTRTIPVLP